ncbi:hypothetical protein D0962_22535 [Leptolyngbyaceae cyanobacterium CCMR0082]|uniref:Uncharacterized protein n=2 Tax=Adonisia turfae TaxID=2950184 RepID=A0A6M0SAN0_9CYAN|nr:hypothetical protein [Adonisia turfae]MDV3349242.1 hypothetical protein [Leptothoe sp. LEGE 181152]NEZ58646.1 hypothetical protein [Adonisia turfae CCMR0081]NEZ65510.1 hypothetical protein [Adonisia turfae CCMR0082]
MIKQMAWLPQDNGQEKILHLRIEQGTSWRPYTMFPQFISPDHMAIGSRGFSTFQKLLREGWELIASDQASQLSLFNGPEPA